MPKLTFSQLFCNIARYRAMIFALALRDIQSRYAGTLGGTLWVFLHPLAVVVVFYFVFAIGFRSQAPGSTPFILWFVSGLVPWLYFNETLQAITDSVRRNAHLVKKTVFPTEILPFVHLISGLLPHVIFLFIVVGMLAFFKVPFLVERLLVVYFLICSCTLLIGIGWMLSALQVFSRDISQGLTIILNLWFWITPIVWSADIMPAEYRGLMFYNPVYYIIEGYRGLLIYNSVVWPSARATVYFWGVTTLAFFVGNYVFRRLKPEFADVL